MADAAQADQPVAETPNIAGHEVMDRLGDGGCATVWKCREHGSGRIVAVKVPRPELASADFIERFEDECQLLLRLRTHPNVVGVIGRTVAVLADGRRVPALVMEYIANGRTLLEHADAAALSLHERLQLFRAVCAGVAHLHKAGIVHLDLKPKNILVDDTGTPRVMDLGAAKVLLANDPRSAFFTAQYASPEQLRGAPEALEQTSDVYSLGKILAALVAGPAAIALPERSGSTGNPAAAALAWRSSSFATALPRPLPSIERIVDRATAPLPGQRYDDASALALSLDDAMTPWTTHAVAIARRAGESMPPWLKSALVIALLGLLAALITIPLTVAGVIYNRTQVLTLAWPTVEHLWDVRVVVVPAKVDFEKLADASGTTDLGEAAGQLRAMWAKVIDVLSAAGAAAIVCDVAFPRTDQHTDRTRALADAIVRARSEHNCQVVVAIDGIAASMPTENQVTPELLRAGATFGGTRFWTLDTTAFTVPVAINPPMRRAMLSLSTAGVAAFMGRSGDCDVILDERAGELMIVPDAIDGRRVPIWRTGRHPLTDHRGDPIVLDGVNEGDVVGLLAMGALDRDALAEATVDVETVLAMSSMELSEFARGRVIVLANNFKGKEEMSIAGGGTILKPWLHAAAIQLMLRPPGVPAGNEALFLWMVVAGAVGAALWAISGGAASGAVRTASPGAAHLMRRGVAVALVAAIVVVAAWVVAGALAVQISYRPAAVVISLCVGAVLGVEYRLLRRAWSMRTA